MTAYMRADSIKIDDDEGRFVLIVSDEEGGPDLQIDIHHLALEFWAQAKSTLGEYAAEAEMGRIFAPLFAPQPVTNRPVSVEDAIEAGYALDDPKSPGYHDRMVD